LNLGIFLRKSISFDFNTHICLFLYVFFYFQRPSERQTDPIFLPHHFFGKYKTVRRRSQRGMPHGPKEDPPCRATSWPCGGPIFNLVGPIAANFASMEPPRPKMTIKRPPMQSRDRAVEKHKIHNMDLQTGRI
jgi:hypothetical protein